MKGDYLVPGSIRDVAKSAGVSIGTVSRAFNNYTDIKPETKKKIFEAAKRLEYSPNLSARNLSSKNKKNIALIVSGLLENNPKENLTFSMIQGVYTYACNNGLEVAVYATDSAHQKDLSYRRFCLEHSVAGVILSGVTTDDAYFNELLETTEIPCVAIDVEIPGKRVGWVSIDNMTAAKEIANLLLDNGHRRILVISGKKNASVTVERMVGVYAALEDAGGRLTNDSVLYCNFNEETAYEKTREYLLKNGTSKHTAFLCFSDIMALGVMRAVRECGYRIPEDFSVTGFDGIPISEYTTPPLTTVVQDMKESGYAGAKMLHERMEKKTGIEHDTLPHRIIERKSIRNLLKDSREKNQA